MKRRLKIKQSVLIIMIILLLLTIILLSPLILFNIKLIGDKHTVVNYGEEYNESGYRLKVFGKNLKDEIKVSDNIKTDIGTYQVTYTYKFLFYNIKRVRTVEIKDIEGPKIVLNNENENDVVINEEYIEKGAIATDNKDGDLTDKIKITGTVDNTKLGTYEIVYEVTDNSGNTSKKIRKVNVVRKSPMQMSVNEYSLDGWYDEVKLKQTDNKGNDYFNSLILVGDSNMKNMYEYGHVNNGKSWSTPCLHAESIHYTNLNIYGTGLQMTLIDAVKKYKPEKMILNFGSFSSLWISEEVFVNSSKSMIEKIKEASPNTKIVLISIYPVTKNGINNDNFSQNSINKRNFKLLEIAKEYNLKYLDVQTVLKDSTGYGNPSYYISDGFHLTSYGQSIVKEYIKTHAF